MLPVIAEHIEITPDICGSEPHIAGHEIKVRDVVIWHEKMGLFPRELLSRYPMQSGASHICKNRKKKNAFSARAEYSKIQKIRSHRTALQLVRWCLVRALCTSTN